MKILLDTNIIIPAEPTQHDEIVPNTELATTLIRTAQQGGHQLYFHPASMRDIRKDRNPTRRQGLQTLLKKYVRLPNPPDVSKNLTDVIGKSAPGTNDEVDDLLLAAVHSDAVDFLVSEDQRILAKATRADIQHRVFSLEEIIKTLKALFPKDPPPPPAVTKMLAHELNETDPIFKSFGEDYPEFNSWLIKCKREHRDAWIVRGHGGECAGVCIVKNETTREHSLSGKVLKICSFKIADSAFGCGFGELLLKSVFNHAFSNDFAYIYVEVFKKFRGLIRLFEDFGFKTTSLKTPRTEEFVLIKKLNYSGEEYRKLDPLEFNVKYGPNKIKLDGISVYVVPIKPMYHTILFPEVETQTELFPGRHAFGNAIRKAYLCHAKVKELESGSVILFYRSEDTRAVHCIGVTERTARAQDPHAILRFVGKRTVYSFEEIEGLCRKEVLAILFRHAVVLRKMLDLRHLIKSGILSGPPQSIVAAQKEDTKWLKTILAQ